jgi:SAM-dependent methyltransferase
MQDVETAYREDILHEKLRLDSAYLTRRSARYDVQILLATVGLGAMSTGSADDLDLDEFIEWGGSAWRGLTGRAVEQMGDLHGKRVLEIGTRSGRMATYFALAGADVVGIDVTDGFEEAARDFATSRGATSVEFIRDDGQLGSIQGRTFDVVFTKSVLVIVEERLEYLGRIHSLLGPDGLIVAIENGRGGWLAEALRRLRRTTWDHLNVAYLDERDVEAMSKLFEPVHIERRRLPPVWLFVGRARHAEGGRTPGHE